MTIFIGIVGSRNYQNVDLVRVHIKAFSLRKDIVIVTGGIGKVDEEAEQSCYRYGMTPIVKRPDLERYGDPAAFHIRNDEILKMVKKVLIYWDGKSSGSASMVKKAMERHIDFSVFYDAPKEEQTIPC